MTARKLTRREAADRYEARTLTFTDGSRCRVLNVTETGRIFCTAYVQRINKDGSTDRRDVDYGRLRTFSHDAIETVS